MPKKRVKNNKKSPRRWTRESGKPRLDPNRTKGERFRNKFICPICDAYGPDMQTLQVHMREHVIRKQVPLPPEPDSLLEQILENRDALFSDGDFVSKYTASAGIYFLSIFAWDEDERDHNAHHCTIEELYADWHALTEMADASVDNQGNHWDYPRKYLDEIAPGEAVLQACPKTVEELAELMPPAAMTNLEDVFHNLYETLGGSGGFSVMDWSWKGRAKRLMLNAVQVFMQTLRRRKGALLAAGGF